MWDSTGNSVARKDDRWAGVTSAPNSPPLRARWSRSCAEAGRAGSIKSSLVSQAHASANGASVGAAFGPAEAIEAEQTWQVGEI